MKKNSIGLILLVIVFSFKPSNDFTKSLLLYWSFNDVAAAPPFFKSHINARGYSGGSLELKGISFPVTLVKSVDLKKRFSINFWFKPQNLNDNKPIVLFGDSKTSGIEFGMRNQTIYCKIGGQVVEHYPYMILDKDWSLASLSYDGQTFHLTLFSSQVTSTTHFAVSSFTSPFQVTDLHIAPGKSPFRGFIDEIMIYEKEIKAKDLEQMYQGKLPDENKNEALANKAARNSNQTALSVSEEAKQQLTTTGNKRNRFSAGETIVNQKALILEVQNWKKLRERCHIMLNDTVIINGNADPTGVALVELETNESNALTFSIPRNVQPEKLKLRLLDGMDEVHKFDVTTRADGDVTYTITHRSIGEPITEVQKSMTVSQRTLTIEVWDDKLTDGDYVSVFCNDEKVIDYQEISKEKIVVELLVDPDKNNLISFVAEDSGKYGNNSARVRILENGRLVDEFRFTSTYRKKAGLLIRVRDGN